MAYGIIMPKAGMAMEEGKIVKWLKAEGEEITKGEAILEIETDKTTMEVEAEYSGVLVKIIKEAGQTVPVTEIIGYIGAKDEKVEMAKKPQTEVPTEVPKEPKATDGYDVVVIGGGPAGYIAAIKAARLGGRVALVEKDTVGGTCLNRGCIPTKTYLKTAEMIDHLRALDGRGVAVSDTSFAVDMAKAKAGKDGIVRKLTSGVGALLKSNGVEVFKGEGVIKPDRTVVVGGQKTLQTRTVICAGGSIAHKINIPGVESKLVITSDEILDLTNIPDRLVIIGGGVIGVEMATVFSRFGSRVHIIELEDRIIPQMDAEVSITLRKALEAQGIKVSTSAKIAGFDENDGDLYVLTGSGDRIECDLALLSIGRIPDLSALREVNVEIVRGRVKTNGYMQSSINWIYTPGDINGQLMLAHAAFKMGETAALNAMGYEASADLRFVPGCIYTMPEVGCVGITEEQAKKGHDIGIGKFPFSANGRALASSEGEGFIKVITDKKYGEILGVHIVGPNAAEQINEAAALMAMEITADEIAEIIHAHPTYSEAFMEAVADSIGQCLHLPPK